MIRTANVRSESRSRLRSTLLLSTLLLVPLALACGSDATPEADEGPPPRLESTPDTSPGTTFPSLERSDTVQVSLDEYTIEVPAILPPGRTVFRVTNQGQEVHNFLVAHDGSRTGIDEGLAPGRTGHMTMDLDPGTYVLLCTVAGHDTRGMTEEIEVPPAATLDDSLAERP